MEYPSYKYPVEVLYTGSSLGNRYAFARLDATTNLRGLWSSVDNQFYVGEWRIEVFVNGSELKPRETLFSPESQTTYLSNGVFRAEKQFFLPFSLDERDRERASDLQVAILLFRCTNSSPYDAEVLLRHSVTIPAVSSELFTKKPPEEQIKRRVNVHRQEGHCEIVTLTNPSEVRIFGSTAKWISCSADDQMLLAEYKLHLRSGESTETPFFISFSPNGTAAPVGEFLDRRDARKILERTIGQYIEVLSRTLIFTPEPVINRGLQWAKVNTVRVQHQYCIGAGFTNDPPQDIVVIRDLAWYMLGSDYLTPEFSRNLLTLCEKYAFHDGGKLTEYIHANEDPPALHDYKLNINDDTPLYVYALFHHALTCEGETFLERAYSLMKRACDWILSQIHDGLIRCYADGTHIWGICSWRNIIDGYNLSGAVTEINTECYNALNLTAEVAERLGRSDEAKFYQESAERLKQAINTKLVSENTGLYLLNLGNDGLRHHDVTGDLIFPVMFGVAEGNMRKRILKELTTDDMWTPYGVRTVSKHEQNYDPDFGSQLVGGVWPNLTAWVAFCIRDSDPEKLVEGMMNLYKLAEIERPADFVNVVPGEFPERLHGETYVSRGMAMSPWMPPTYLWLGVEGLLGVKPTLDGLEMNPVLPTGWKWIGVKNLPYKGKSITAFLYDRTLYTTYRVESPYPVKIGTQIDTFADNDKIFSIGMQVADDVFLFIAADQKVEGNVVLQYHTTRFEKYVQLEQGEALLLRGPGVYPIP